MRFLPLLFLFMSAASAGVPPELAAALKEFRGDPPRGWSFTQTTVADGKSIVERSDAARPDYARWTLVQKDGRTPTTDELKEYAEGRSRRSRAGTAPPITEQFDPGSIETISETAERGTYRFRLRPGETRDKTAPFLRATLVLHRPTRTIESIELANAGEFNPTIGVTIRELKTRMTYSLPAGDTPSFPQAVTTHVRGTAFFFKSLDADMAVTFSDFVKAGRFSK